MRTYFIQPTRSSTGHPLSSLLDFPRRHATYRMSPEPDSSPSPCYCATLTPVFGQTPPSITSEPADQVVDVGATATFTVTATGTAPLTYQWRFNDANLAGKTSRSLVLANVQSTNAGNYTVVVTNAFGSVTSRIALLTFTTVHRIDGITANPDHTISLSLAGVVPSALCSLLRHLSARSFHEPGGLVAVGHAPAHERFPGRIELSRPRRDEFRPTVLPDSHQLFNHPFPQTVRSLPGGDCFPTDDRSIANQSLQHPHEQFVHGDVLVSSRGQGRSAPGCLR